MREHLIIDGNAVYEIDMECMEKLERKKEPSLEVTNKTVKGMDEHGNINRIKEKHSKR